MQQRDPDSSERIQFKIKGMRSVQCAGIIEEILLAMEGVREASVHYSSRGGIVVIQPGSLSFQSIKEEVRKAGYEIDLEERGTQSVNSFSFKQFLYASLTSAPLLLSMVFERAFGGPLLTEAVQLILASLIQVIFAIPVYVGAACTLRKGVLGGEFLASLAIFAAYLYSLFLFSMGVQAPFHFEVSAFIITALLLGRWLEERSLDKARELVADLSEVLPKKTLVKIGDYFEEKGSSVLFSGDIVMIRPGEKIPVDGLVIEGVSSVDETAITGEGERVRKKPGDSVLGGTTAVDGILIVRSEKVGRDTAAGVLFNMVQKVLDTKAPIQGTIEKALTYLIPVALLISLGAFLYHASSGNMDAAVMSAIAVLVAASPSALANAAPTTLLVATVLGAKSGFLFQSKASVEKAGRLDLMIFDKTGTLTVGDPRIVEVIPLSALSEGEILSISASLEMNASHPLAKAVVAKAKERELLKGKADNAEFKPGTGVSGEIEGKRYFLGSVLFARERGHVVNEEIHGGGDRTKIYLFDQNQLLGVLVVEDPVRESSLHAVRQLKLLNIVPVMVTGDNPDVAEALSHRLGINTVFPDILPQGKLEKVEFYKRNGHRVGFVGDGINDSLAIAKADVGFAMGSAVRVANESSDVTLFGNDLMSVGLAVHLSRNALAKIYQNLQLAGVLLLLFVPLAAFGILNPSALSVVMAITPVLVTVNSLLLKR